MNSPAVEYHLRELQVALDPASPGHVLPAIGAADESILDVGCGIGQTLVAGGGASGRLLVGVDIDLDCLQYGRAHFPAIAFLHSGAEQLPFRDAAFDLVVSRVALPYTVLRQSLPETARVLRAGGRVWFTLHPFTKTRHHLARAIRELAWKDVIFQCYVIANGLSLHWFGRQFRFPVNGRCESFQTVRGMRRLLGRMGFADVAFPAGRHFLCTARKCARDG